ncbi:MAG TPA: M50 family metallopeptidase, partial [Fimbriimonadaceae bacterium]|nr:M50 family metallopeptidase [Fimbriimonadaceae bacterium]
MQDYGLGKEDRAPQRTTLLLAASAVLLCWVIPGLHWLTMPLQYLYTHLHEIGHALAAVVSGGVGVRIEVFSNGSGVTESWGGSQLLMSPAGYVGATAMGAMLLALARDEKGAKAGLMGLGGLIALAVLLWVRGDLFGLFSALVFAALLLGLGAKLPKEMAVPTAQFLGVYLCLASIQSVLAIFGIGGMALENDALILERATGIPAILSAVTWTLLS